MAGDAAEDARTSALGAGSALVSRDILKNRDWPQLTIRAREFVAAAAQ
jgi:2-keto-3-deoxy-6-phosphogluconate aldolase